MDDDDRQAHGGASVDMELLMKNVKTKAVTHEMPQHLKGRIVQGTITSFVLMIYIHF